MHQSRHAGHLRIIRNARYAQGLMCVWIMQAYQEGECKPDPEVCVATVDSFQGKERRVVVGSLVRSNASGKLGFLSAPQRVNVLLSRARDGLILVANPFTLLGHTGAVEEFTGCSGGPQQLRYDAATAAALQHQLQSSGTEAEKKPTRADSTWATVLGKGSLPVVTGVNVVRQCRKHPIKQVLQTPADFANHPRLGKCSFLCKAKMKCGHKCKRPCHSGEHVCSLC